MLSSPCFHEVYNSFFLMILYTHVIVLKISICHSLLFSSTPSPTTSFPFQIYLFLTYFIFYLNISYNIPWFHFLLPCLLTDYPHLSTPNLSFSPFSSPSLTSFCLACSYAFSTKHMWSWESQSNPSSHDP